MLSAARDVVQPRRDRTRGGDHHITNVRGAPLLPSPARSGDWSDGAVEGASVEIARKVEGREVGCR